MSEHIEAMAQYIEEVKALAVKAEQERIIALIGQIDLGVENQLAKALQRLLNETGEREHD